MNRKHRIFWSDSELRGGRAFDAVSRRVFDVVRTVRNDAEIAELERRLDLENIRNDLQEEVQIILPSRSHYKRLSLPGHISDDEFSPGFVDWKDRVLFDLIGRSPIIALPSLCNTGPYQFQIEREVFFHCVNKVPYRDLVLFSEEGDFVCTTDSDFHLTVFGAADQKLRELETLVSEIGGTCVILREFGNLFPVKDEAVRRVEEITKLEWS